MSRIDELIEQMRTLEEQMEAEYDRKRSDFYSVVDARRVHFSEQVAALQRGRRVGLFGYVTRASFLSWIVAPIIYSFIVPLALLDVALLVYQATCFRVYHIAKVTRSDYVVLDRGDLPYLNALEQFNCFYCGYANGLVGYAREVAARTEQYFCPIKHARRILTAHDHYPGFFEYGDAESYRAGLKRLREALAAQPDAGAEG